MAEHTVHPNQRVLLVGGTQCNNVLLRSSTSTNESPMGWADIVDPERLRLVKRHILITFAAEHRIIENTLY